MLDKGSFHCLGSTTVFDGKTGYTRYCDALFHAGDKILGVFTSGAEDNHFNRGTIVGTGRYEGITLDGKGELLGPFPQQKPGTTQGCNHQTGIYKLK